MRLKGFVAIEYAEMNCLKLSKYNDPIEPARDGLSIEEALEVARQDSSLIYLDIEEEDCGECDMSGPTYEQLDHKPTHRQNCKTGHNRFFAWLEKEKI
jgi:hypothetical protein